MRRAAPALLFAVSASPGFAEGLATGSAPGVPWLRLMLSLAFCLALAWGAVVLLRHHQRRGIANPIRGLFQEGTSPSKRISILETRRASVHADLCLVECDGETYFIALTAAGTTVLNRSPAPGGAV